MRSSSGLPRKGITASAGSRASETTYWLAIQGSVNVLARAASSKHKMRNVFFIALLVVAIGEFDYAQPNQPVDPHSRAPISKSNTVSLYPAFGIAQIRQTPPIQKKVPTLAQGVRRDG